MLKMPISATAIGNMYHAGQNVRGARPLSLRCSEEKSVLLLQISAKWFF